MYFPLIISKTVAVADGDRCTNQAVAGAIVQPGGIAFGIRNAGNYFCAAFLWKTMSSSSSSSTGRIERRVETVAIDSNVWHLLRVEIDQNQIRGFFNDKLLVEYGADKSIAGHVGLWTKADSVVWFDEFLLATKNTISDLFGDLRLAGA
jgi:hypothetical protein